MAKILVVIDMQKDFVDGSLGTPEAVSIVPSVANRIRAFDGDMIYVTYDTHGNDYDATLEGKKLPVAHCQEGTAGHALDPLVEEALSDKPCMRITKRTFGTFEIAEDIRKRFGDCGLQIECLGLCTDICVISNVLILRAAFPNALISVDPSCCAGVTPDLHDAALSAMRSCQIDVLDKNVQKDARPSFDPVRVKNDCVEWIRDFFEKNGPGCNAVVGISGGKDSSIVAALCSEALGKDRVIGVLMPCGEQSDIDMAKLLVTHLGIRHYVVNIKDAVDGVTNAIPFDLSRQSTINLPPRIRMSTLYAVSQSHNGRVANTCNLSEDWVGYSTRYGDSVGDFSPCSHLTVHEMKAVGRVLGLPEVLIEKKPADGLTGLTDEDNLGFTYAELDRYIRTGEIDDPEKKEKIDRLHRINQFKLELMPSFDPGF